MIIRAKVGEAWRDVDVAITVAAVAARAKRSVQAYVTWTPVAHDSPDDGQQSAPKFLKFGGAYTPATFRIFFNVLCT